MEKAKLVKWLLMNNIYIDEYLCLSDFLAKNLARNKKSRCLNRKTYFLYPLIRMQTSSTRKVVFFYAQKVCS